MAQYIKIPDTNSTITINGFVFGVEKPKWNLETHYHPIFELIFCIEGSALQWINEECMEFNKGDWVFLNPGVRHRTLNQSESVFSYMAIHFDIDDLNLRKLLKKSALNHVPYQKAVGTKLANYTREIDDLIQKIIWNKSYKLNGNDIVLNMTEVDKLLFQANIIGCISEYIKLVEYYNQANRDTDITLQQLEIAYQIEALLSKNVSGYLNINDITDAIGYSRSHCTRIFTQVFGSSPRQYYTNLKLKKAKELLLGTKKSIDEISSELGFSSVYHFSRQFKRWTSKSPSEYRMNPAT